MLLTTVREAGKLRLTVYYYERAGDELPEHVHDDTNNHITVVSVGSFRVTGDPKIAGTILTQGMVVDWPAGQPHGFVAMSDGCRMIQIPK
jgi:quercetin dioxygenase-like cupin family protein